jgi:hypothetical protein
MLLKTFSSSERDIYAAAELSPHFGSDYVLLEDARLSVAHSAGHHRRRQRSVGHTGRDHPPASNHAFVGNLWEAETAVRTSH